MPANQEIFLFILTAAFYLGAASTLGGDERRMKYTNEDLIAMYKTMILARVYDQEMTRQNAKGRMQAMLHFSINQEAIGTGIVAAMHDDEPFLPSHRNRALHLFRMNIYKYMSEQMGTTKGIHGGVSGDFHISVPEIGFIANPGVLGTATPIAAGYAFALKHKHPGRAIVNTLGDGTFSQGMVQEALGWTAIQQLPIVYVVENNGYAMSTTPDIYRADNNIAERARAAGLEGVVVDGNDVLAMREVMDVAMERARKNIPSLIEARTYRVTGHYNGDMTQYRANEYHEEMMCRYPDPVPRYEKVLIDNEIATQEELDAIKTDTRKKIEQICDRVYKESLDPANKPKVETVLDINKTWASPMEGLQ